MKKIAKWIGLLVGIVVLFAILLMISLITFVNPNRFKPFIAEKIQKQTGRQLIMDGDLSWTLFPTFGIKTGHVVLKNPAGFNQGIFAEVNDITVSVRLMPLLSKKIESGGIKLTGMKLHLIKNSQGQVNWNVLENTTSNNSKSEVHNKSSAVAVAILGLDIANSEVTWTDEQAKPAKSGNLTLNGKISITNLMTETMAIKGNFIIDQFVMDHVKMSNVVIPLSYQNGIVSLKSISALFYQGKWRGDVKIDLNTAVPQYSVMATFEQFNLSALLQDLSSKQKLSLGGKANIDMQVTTRGSEKPMILKNLNGSGHLSFNDGVLQGIDINYLISSARAMRAKTITSEKNTKQTNFKEFKGGFVIQEGVIMSNDLVMSSNDFTTKAQGAINLVNQTIDYHLQTYLIQARLPIPIRIVGDLTAPTMGLDVDALTKAIAEEQVEKFKSRLEERIQKGKIPEKAGNFLKNLLGR